ncbi:MAG: ABC transporter permease [Candidatus Obscuribacterales bacterium]|nr:ABC transporter permease [Steroidobacteraceae bacterium]
MSALLRKEFRDLRSWGILSIAIGLLDVVSSLMSQVDMRPLGVMFASVNDAGVVVFWLMAFAIGTGLTTREHDDGTLAFLDGLPLSRTKMFFVKCAVTTALVLLAPLVRLLSVGVLHVLSRGSLDESLRVDILLQVLALQTLLMCNGIFLGAALGRLRSLTWLVAGMLATGLLLLVKQYPRAALLDPTALLDTHLGTDGLEIDAELLVTQVGLSAIALLIAWRGFLHMGQSRRVSLPSRPVVGAIVTVMTIASLSAVVIVLASRENQQRTNSNSTDAGEEPYFYPSAPAQSVTAHYRFSYPADGAQATLLLAAKADAIFEEVHRLLGVEPGAMIDVDTSGSARNTHGTAYYSRIRMQLGDDAAAVLAHETAHVVSQRIAGDEKDWLWREASTLNEGIADWVMEHFDANLHSDSEALFVLAALHARRQLLIDELADVELLALSRDENLKYPAGKALISAMVRLHGATALPRLLRAFADKRLPTDLRGLSLWQATFQLADMNLGSVVDEFYREIAARGEVDSARIAALPRPRVHLVTDGRRMGVEALVDREIESGQSLRIRFKPKPDSERDSIDSYGALPFEPVWRRSSQIANGRICVQVGLWTPDDQVLYEPWTCLPTRDAVQWQAEDDVTEDEPRN